MKEFIQKVAILKRHLGISVSAFMHLILFSLILINFPQCERKKSQERIITVDLLPITQNTNIENKQTSKQEKKEEKIEKKQPSVKQEEVKNYPLPEPTPEKEEVKSEPKSEKILPIKEKEEVKKEPKPEEISPAPKEKKVEPKKETKKTKDLPKKIEKKKDKKPQMTEFEKLLKDLRAEEKKNDLQQKVADKPSKGPYNPNNSLSLSVKDSIRIQIEKHWNPPAGNRDAAKLQILLRISLKSDGSVASVKIVDNMLYNSNDMYRVAADAAIRAVYKASPLQGLPLNQYNVWQDLEFDFNPAGILGE